MPAVSSGGDASELAARPAATAGEARPPSLAWIPPDFAIVAGLGRRPGGNLILRRGNESRVLKVYQRRHRPLREAVARVSHRFFERKRDPDPRRRCETERISLELWSRHGFDVPQRLPGTLPAWLGERAALWLEYLPGRPLFWVVHDPDVAEDFKLEQVRRQARADRRRHTLALELGEPLLLHEHPTTKHVLVFDGRLVTVDLEGGYQERFPVPAAISLELAGVLRSLWGVEGRPCFEEAAPRAYVEAYEDRALLRAACRHALRAGVGPYLKRRSDRRRRGYRCKTNVMKQLLERLGP